MFAVTPLLAILLQAVPSSVTVPRDSSDTIRANPAATSFDSTRSIRIADDTVKRRARPVDYSEWYARRLEIHRIGSYAMLPIFAGQYYVGQQLLNGTSTSGSNRDLHAALGLAIGTLFTVNTGTGLWNLWDSRSDPAGRTRRVIHAVTMMASDAGFIWTGAIGGDSRRSNQTAQHHRNVAIGSMAVATAGTVMMWLWKD